MSKRGYISRYMLILKRVKSKPYSSYEDLLGYIDSQLQYFQMRDDDLTVGFSKRTLQRDLREIRNLFGIDIEFSKLRKGYHLIDDGAENMNFQRMMEAFDMFSSLNAGQEINKFILMEQRHPVGTEHIAGLLHAIKNSQIVGFDYQKFDDEIASARTIAPYALKEFKNRWYIIGKDIAENSDKTFALDRLANLTISNKRFVPPEAGLVRGNFEFCFGIIGPTVEGAQDVILSFHPFQGKYIKTLPLHHTQFMMADDKTEVRVKLHLNITFDFIMELLSFGDLVSVIEPISLEETMKKIYKKALSQYKKKQSINK